MTGEAILSIRNISRAFPGVLALDDVTFSVERGSIHALVGANGAGKSTLMKILSGAIIPDAGDIQLDGAPFSPSNPKEAIKAGISTIYQELNLLLQRSVIQNIVIGKEPAKMGWLDFKEARKEAKAVLEQMKAEHIPLDAAVNLLKVGEKQIVEIGKALIADCKVLIMDEPTAALNNAESEALFAIIRDMKKRGVTILYVSHRLSEIFKLADSVTVLRDGKHILTESILNVTPDNLITAMIGRQLEGVFPERNRLLGDVVLEVSGLTSTGVFQEITFTLRGGEVLAVTGLTGSGKTELGKAIFGDYPVSAGKICYFGEERHPDPTMAVARRVGYMPEDRKKEGVLEELPIQRNIGLALLPRLANAFGWINREEEKKTAEEQVLNLQIKTPTIKQLVRNLSGGNQQKVSLAKWLASGSRLLILMEPTQGIDVGVKFEIYQLIARLSKEGVAVLLISSEIPEILGLAHRILVMHNGDIKGELIAEKTDTEEILQYTFGQKKEINHG
jgi:ABC-type sugar transport system ATPase subunit